MRLIDVRPWRPQDLLDDLQELIDGEPDSYRNTKRATLCMARDYLREYFSAQENNPLTLEELREMDGEPVWIEVGNFHIDGKATFKSWTVIIGVSDTGIWTLGSTGTLDFFTYGMIWKAYRRKPEGTA